MSESINVEIPTVGESISEVQIGQWLKSEGDWVASGEDLVEIETEKASVQIPSPAGGFLENIRVAEEDFATVGDVIASIRVAPQPSGGGPERTAPPTSSAASPDADYRSSAESVTATATAIATVAERSAAGFVMPAAQRMLDEHALSAADVPATGPGGRLLKEDVQAYIRNRPNTAPQATPTPSVQAPATQPPATQPPATQPAVTQPAVPTPPVTTQRVTTQPVPESTLLPAASLMTDLSPHRSEEVRPMSMLRRTIAARLVEAQQTAALLTTFNEINMQPVMSIRKQYKDAFAEKHGVKLGFMSFFAKAVVEALRNYPAVNAEIRGDSIVYRNYQDIGIAIGGGKGLVVPVLRNVERMSFSDIERAIADFARLAGENRLQPSDLLGGTFTISNGGIYGSLLSTPIVNPPQSGILGLHAIQDRPVAVDGNVVIRPTMYIALTYDHRIVDGREAVGFLRTIKEVIEEPARLFLEL